MSPTEKLIDKLAALKRHADSAKAINSLEEADAFAQMLNKLLTQHKLSMSDIEFEQFEKEQPVERYAIDYTKYPDVKVKKKRIDWIETLANVIAQAHFCRILVQSNSSRIWLVGRKEDTQVVEYLIITLQRAAERLADKAYADFSTLCVKECEVCGDTRIEHHGSWHEFKPNWAKCRGYRPAFIQAFVTRLMVRYEELKRARETGSTALVRFNKAEHAVVAWMENQKIKNASALSREAVYNRHGITHGREAADKVQLTANALEAKHGQAHNKQLKGE